MKLGGGDGSHTTLFDSEDRERVQMHIWSVRRDSEIRFYAQTTVGRTTLPLHRHLWPDFPAESKIDHRNRNGKDNRRANLRNGEDAVNENNNGVRSDNKGYLTGVSRNDTSRRWSVSIGTRGKVGYDQKWFSDARHGGREQAYAAACAQRILWADAAGNQNGREPR